MEKNTSLVILCGGKGKRLGNITKKIAKPLIRINNKPFIEYLIKFYQRYLFKQIETDLQKKNGDSWGTTPSWENDISPSAVRFK